MTATEDGFRANYPGEPTVESIAYDSEFHLSLPGRVYRAADALRRRARADNHGMIGEDLAHRYLRSQGCTIVARNYRTRSGSGEIDLVAWHGGVLVFVEVKTRESSEFGPPDRAVDEALAAGRIPATMNGGECPNPNAPIRMVQSSIRQSIHFDTGGARC